MKKRLGDRRSRPRFDIVGSLMGQVETWQHYGVHNLGSGGEFVETTLPLSPGTRLSGRVSAGDGNFHVRAQVTHSRLLTSEDRGRYLVGLQWIETSVPFDALLAAISREEVDTGRAELHDEALTTRGGPVDTDPDGLSRVSEAPAERGGDQDREERPLPPPPGCDVALWVAATAKILDISGSGLLFSSRMALDTGARAQLRLRLGDEDFASEIEVRRVAVSDGTDWCVGAKFVSLDGASRRSLDSLLG